MIEFGRNDQFGVDVDADHVMSERCEATADPSGATTGVEHPGAARNHRVDEPGLAIEIPTLCSHRPKSLDVPRRMTRVLLNHPQPSIVAHIDRVPTRLQLSKVQSGRLY